MVELATKIVAFAIIAYATLVFAGCTAMVVFGG